VKMRANRRGWNGDRLEKNAASPFLARMRRETFIETQHDKSEKDQFCDELNATVEKTRKGRECLLCNSIRTNSDCASKFRSNEDTVVSIDRPNVYRDNDNRIIPQLSVAASQQP